jgi:hypothetical protein
LGCGFFIIQDSEFKNIYFDLIEFHYLRLGGSAFGRAADNDEIQ